MTKPKIKLPTVYPVKHPVHEFADVVGPLIAHCWFHRRKLHA